MVFRPLPESIDERSYILALDYNKDVDAISPINIGKTFEFDNRGFNSCTPKGRYRAFKIL